MKKTILALLMGITVLTTVATPNAQAYAITRDEVEVMPVSYDDKKGEWIVKWVNKKTGEEVDPKDIEEPKKEEPKSEVKEETETSYGHNKWNSGPLAKFGCHIEYDEKTKTYKNFRLIEAAGIGVDIYKKPSTSSKIIGVKSASSEYRYMVAYTNRKDCTLTGKWIKINYNGGYAYIPNKKGTWKYSKEESYTTTTTCPTKLYKTADGFEPIMNIKQGAKIKVIGVSRWDRFVKVKYKGKVGYVKLGHTLEEGDESYFKKAYIINNHTVLYASDSTKSKKLGKYKYGKPIKVVAKRDAWFKVKVDGKTGWVMYNCIGHSKNTTTYAKTRKVEEVVIDYTHKEFDTLACEYGYNNIGYEYKFGCKGNDAAIIYIAPNGKYYPIGTKESGN